ncbi:ornithine racemase Orr [Romboutsia sp. 1001713B170131_170501_G6]|uniref:ornithine racemase Orr n=1 Tax=Romboutsia sp. 1001713B170131_170501_G6 TaxID=2787108 RepID=UPI0018A9CA02
MYPRLEINIPKLKHNVCRLKSILNEENLKMAIVTKAYCAMPEVVEEISSKYVDYIADSRIENLKKLQSIKLPKILLRIPMISKSKEVVKYSDISFNSEIETIYRLNEEAKNINKVHNIVLMLDLGDLREGYFNEEELYDVVEKVLKLKNIKLIGVGTNLTCYGAILPSQENLGRLVKIAKNIEDKHKIKLEFISGGNSSSIYLLQEGKLPKGITNLRLGEAILLGKEAAYGNFIEETYHDSFKLYCEIIEIKDKPSMPIGEIGKDAFGKVPHYEDNGIIKRAIVGIGKQDIDIESIIPTDENIQIIGASSDHMILDITNSEIIYNIGDRLGFVVTSYGGILTACTSNYVEKKAVYNLGTQIQLA